MNKPVFVPNVPKVYIEEEGKRIEVENVIGIYPELKLIEILPNFRKESLYILRGRYYLLEPFEVFIVFEDKEFSFLGSVDINYNEYNVPEEEDYYNPAEIEESSSNTYITTNMYIHLYPKESDLNGNNES